MRSALKDSKSDPPQGDRSVPPNSLLGKQKDLPPGITALQIYNEHVAVFAQVEDVYGLENVEEIANVPGCTFNSCSSYFSLGFGFNN